MNAKQNNTDDAAPPDSNELKRCGVLFLDDESAILRSIERIVIREPYRKFYVSNAADALKCIETEEIDVVVADMKMPGMDGLTFLGRIRESHPTIVRIVLSGFSQASQVIAAINKGEIFRFFTKPIEDPHGLRDTILQALDERRQQSKRIGLNSRAAIIAEEISRLSAELARHIDDSRRLLALLEKQHAELTQLSALEHPEMKP
ncbi:MAG: response regulator [bacterium]